MLIDSSKRTPKSNSSTDFQRVTFSQKLLKRNSSQMLPLSTVSSSKNTKNSTLKTATIPPENYSGTALASAAQTALNSASGGYNAHTVTFSNQTYFMTFIAQNSFALNWSAANSPNLQFGFTAIDTTAATSVSSSQACQLTRPHIANLECRSFCLALKY